MGLTVTNEETGRLKVTGTTDTCQAIYSDYVGLKFVYWYNPTTAGDVCNLVDRNGKEIIPIRAAIAGDSQQLAIFKFVDGIYCDDMDSGTLYLYLR